MAAGTGGVDVDLHGGGVVARSSGRATARAGIAGNPSDALGGAALAVPVPGLWAEVELCSAARLAIRGAVDGPLWSGVAEFVDHVDRYGHDGGDRLVSAAISTLHHHVREIGHVGDNGIVGDDSPFEAVWTTNIPRSVGLAGSSAVVIATLRALAGRWGLDLEPATLARLALSAEREQLGVAAGWMDRAVQAHDAATFIDARNRTRTDDDGSRDDGSAEVYMARVEVAVPFDLVVAWDGDGAAPSGRLHGRLRERLEAGDPVVTGAVARLVEAATEATQALREGDRDRLAEAMATTCRTRSELGALDGRTAALGEVARTVGATATSAGSGGAVSVLPGDGDVGDVVARFERAGHSALVTRVG